MTHTTAIITAGGIGRRMGSPLPKQFIQLAGVPIIAHTIKQFLEVPQINKIILVVPADHLEAGKSILQEYQLADKCSITAGGRLRQDSVEAGMLAAGNTDLLIIHDGVRPLVNRRIIENCLLAAKKHGAAIAAIPVKDTLKKVENLSITATIDRTTLWQAQTPQAVRKDLLQKAYKIAQSSNFVGTDESSLLENAGIPVSVVEGSERNLKITQPGDLIIAEAIIKESKMPPNCQIRIGHGYDAHRFVSGRPLILGGVEVAHSHGLDGHSDADVLTHAVCDALLGAAGEGDIGRHFPDSDPLYKGINSLKLLDSVTATLHRKGFGAANIDVTVVAQAPKLAHHLEVMEKNLAAACGINAEQINIKATTTEKMGFTGRLEGIACHAVALIAPLAAED